MRDYLKGLLVFCFSFFTVILVISLVVNPKESVVEEKVEDVKQAEVVVTATVNVNEIIFKVHPEKRIPRTGNWDSRVDFIVRNSSGNTVMSRDLVDTNTQGEGTIELGPGDSVPPGTYTVVLKGISHLARAYTNVEISSAGEYLDFTPYGDVLAGDTHSSRDDFINSLDLSTLITALSTGSYVNDLNQDSLVNSLDLSNQVYNIGKGGDEL